MSSHEPRLVEDTIRINYRGRLQSVTRSIRDKWNAARRKRGLDDYGVVNLAHRMEQGIEFRTSPVQLVRALRILDALFVAAKKRGYRVITREVFKGENLYFVIEGQDVGVTITEASRRKPFHPTAQEKKNQRWHPRYKYHPTGVLTLKIHGYVTEKVRREFKDTPRVRLEDKLTDIMSALQKMSVALKATDWRDKFESRKSALEKNTDCLQQLAERLDNSRWATMTRLAKEWEDRKRVALFVEFITHDQAFVEKVGPQHLECWLNNNPKI